MAVDMAKAFDTLSNNFLDKVFQFFGFGPSIIKWLTLRTAPPVFYWMTALFPESSIWKEGGHRETTYLQIPLTSVYKS